MPGKNAVLQLRFLLVFLLTLPLAAHAYVGPGMGLGLIGSILALGSAFFITLFHFIIAPLRRLLGKKEQDENEERETEEGKPEKDKAGQDTAG